MHERKFAAGLAIVAITMLVIGIIGVTGVSAIPISAGSALLVAGAGFSAYLVNRYLYSIGTADHLKRYDPIC
ncbi:MAG: hypothetical protein S4CHLAM45_14380 [Chlamydiales bacterium]|nr:hypothetical protein [Chlamydiales bacterium]MCH9620053.1 hypothetical protein [Chlamydiales bacterium]MCH9623528.1 hypothetical protein [Chlamydiales bacterium]